MFLFVPSCVFSSKDKINLPGNSKAGVRVGVRVCSTAGTYNQQLITAQWESLPHRKSMGKIIANTLDID